MRTSSGKKTMEKGNRDEEGGDDGCCITLEEKLSDLLDALRRNDSDQWPGKPLTISLDELISGASSAVPHTDSLSSLSFSPSTSNKKESDISASLESLTNTIDTVNAADFGMIHHSVSSSPIRTAGTLASEDVNADESTTLEDLMETYITNLREYRQLHQKNAQQTSCEDK